MDLKYLGRRLKALRLSVVDPKTQKPCSQAAFAKLAGISRGSIQDAELGRGIDGPCIGTLDKWLTASGTSLKQFFGGPGLTDYNVPFEYDAQFEPFFILLAEIVNTDRPDLHHGIFVNLTAIALLARTNYHPDQAQRRSGA